MHAGVCVCRCVSGWVGVDTLACKSLVGNHCVTCFLLVDLLNSIQWKVHNW